MYFKIQKTPKGHFIHLIDNVKQLGNLDLEKEEIAYAEKQFKNDLKFIAFNRYSHQIFIVLLENKKTEFQTLEIVRKLGATLLSTLNEIKSEEITIFNETGNNHFTYGFAEGLALANYQFLKYKSDAKKIAHSLKDVYFDKKSLLPSELKRLQITIDAVYHTRTLVNEPLQFLTAEQLAEEIKRIGKEGQFKVNVLGKAKIEQLNMGGILAVNKGSILPPTFTIMEHKPAHAINKEPIVLVGKGIVYDTGGLSLKPTANSMDRMKSDMSGAALVTGAMFIAGQMDLPLHIIALVPATENRPGQNAYVPGDVIKMYSGKTVEVLNTDAEGRLVLADALHYAKKYRPELVLDFATLTGSASNAIGDVGIVCMGNANEKTKEQLK